MARYHIRGFTLVELIITLVIVGILASVVSIKFIDFSSEAKKSLIKHTSAKFKLAVQTAYTKAVIAGKDSGTHSVTLNGEPAMIHNGYPLLFSGSPAIGRWIGIDMEDVSTANARSNANGLFAEYGTSNQTVTISIYHTDDYDNRATVQCFSRYHIILNSSVPPTYSFADGDC